MNYYDSDINPYDSEEIAMEADRWEETFRLVTGDHSIRVGVHEMNRYDFEVWLERGDEKIKFFGSFDEVVEFIREQYPDADWEQ